MKTYDVSKYSLDHRSDIPNRYSNSNSSELSKLLFTFTYVTDVYTYSEVSDGNTTVLK